MGSVVRIFCLAMLLLRMLRIIVLNNAIHKAILNHLKKTILLPGTLQNLAGEYERVYDTISTGSIFLFQYTYRRLAADRNRRRLEDELH
jgi:hypothetical protein